MSWRDWRANCERCFWRSTKCLPARSRPKLQRGVCWRASCDDGSSQCDEGGGMMSELEQAVDDVILALRRLDSSHREVLGESLRLADRRQYGLGYLGESWLWISEDMI